MSHYDPDVSGPWSDVDDYPPDEFQRRHQEAVPTMQGWGGPQIAPRVGYIYNATAEVPELLGAFLMAVVLMAAGIIPALLLWWLLS